MLMQSATPLGALENATEFLPRHIGIDAADEAHMLSVIGEASRRALIESIVPRSIARSRGMDLPAPLTEAAALAELKAIAGKNQLLKSFIGQGYYGTHTPGVILRNILENPAWYTAYTPYQAEISQGRMEALVNFQTMVCDLTGMPIANASMLDEATAAAEAMTLAKRSVKSKSNVFVVAGDAHPQTIEVIQTRAKPLGLDVMAAAEAILTVANAKMAGAVRVVSIERGHDPRQFAYMPFGGGGALHVCAMMREVGVGTGIVPRYPGVTSALGCVMADMRHDAVQTLNKPLADLDVADLRQRVATLAATCQQRLDSAGVKFVEVQEIIALDMLYAGQTHTVQVPVAADALSHEGIRAAFEAAYRAAFGRVLDGIAVRVMNLRYARVGVRPKFDLTVLAPQTTTVNPSLGVQRVFHAGRWWDAARHARLDLPVGTRIDGPAILEQPDTTVWLEPGFSATVDPLGNLLVRADGEGAA